MTRTYNIPESVKIARAITRFWARVDKTGDCWVWTGHIDSQGYGRYGSRFFPTVLAHRTQQETGPSDSG